MLKTLKNVVVLIGLALFFVVPQFVAAANPITKPFEISGWIPYWRAATGTVETLAHLETFTEINPFGYTVSKDGNLNDAALLLQEPWTSLRKQAKEKRVRFIPTIMWFDEDAMHAVLKDPKKRAAHIRQIVDEVETHDWDGIDIDYEGKLAETRPYFTLFLKELYTKIGNKWVMCTVESRTPLADRYYGTTPPKDAGLYANDFVALNKYCDRVRFMTYDQQTIDAKRGADAEKAGKTYGPVSDVVWVEKAIKEAMKTIPKRKIMIGVPTYGYEWDVKAYSDGFVYDLLWSFNPQWGIDLAAKYGITPERNFGGEMGFTYMPTGNDMKVSPPTSDIYSGHIVAAAAAAVAQAQNTNVSFRMLTWSDAEAIRQKVELAKRLGVRGVSVFKIDGGYDPAIWSVLK
jgi:spore germination protein YaaH